MSNLALGIQYDHLRVCEIKNPEICKISWVAFIQLVAGGKVGPRTIVAHVRVQEKDQLPSFVPVEGPVDNDLFLVVNKQLEEQAPLDLRWSVDRQIVYVHVGDHSFPLTVTRSNVRPRSSSSAAP